MYWDLYVGPSLDTSQTKHPSCWNQHLIQSWWHLIPELRNQHLAQALKITRKSHWNLQEITISIQVIHLRLRHEQYFNIQSTTPLPSHHPIQTNLDSLVQGSLLIHSNSSRLTTPYNFVTPSHKQNKVQYSYFQVHRGIYMYFQSASSSHSDKAREDMTFRGSNNPRNVGTSITKCFKPYQHHPHTLTKVREEITTFRGSNNPRNIGNLKYKIFWMDPPPLIIMFMDSPLFI